MEPTVSLSTHFLFKYHSLSIPINQNGMSCKKSNPIVIKTIRLRWMGIESWVNDTNIKIVHLIRDPRAMITSIYKRPGTWGDALKNASYQCRRMIEDSKLGNTLPYHR